MNNFAQFLAAWSLLGVVVVACLPRNRYPGLWLIVLLGPVVWVVAIAVFLRSK